MELHKGNYTDARLDSFSNFLSEDFVEFISLHLILHPDGKYELTFTLPPDLSEEATIITEIFLPLGEWFQEPICNLLLNAIHEGYVLSKDYTYRKNDENNSEPQGNVPAPPTT